MILATGVGLAALPGAAYASDSVQISVQTANPEQDVPVTLDFSGAAAATGVEGAALIAVVRPSGGIACQGNPPDDQAAAGSNSTSLFDSEYVDGSDATSVGPASFNQAGTFNPPAVGSYLVCAWVVEYNTDQETWSTSAATSTTFSARGPQVEQLTVDPPSRALPNVAFQIGFTTQTDQQLTLDAILKPAGGLPCQSSYELESQQNEPSDDLFEDGTSVFGGPTTTTATVTEKKGSYLICTWVEGPGSEEVDASQSTTLTVEKPPPPPPCVVPKLARDTPLAAAQADIVAAHCTSDTTTERQSSSVPAGDVIELRPRPKSKLKSGAKVALVVSSGPRRHSDRHSSARAAATLPTTVDLNGVGPGAFQGAYGVQHPRSMDFGPIPIGYTLSATSVHWTGWGSPTAIGSGQVKYCPNMEPCTSGAFTLRLSDRSFVSCPSGPSHYGYRRMKLDLAQEGGGNWSYRVLVGCTQST